MRRHDLIRSHVVNIVEQARAKGDFADLSRHDLAGLDLSNLDLTGPAFDGASNTQLLRAECAQTLFRYCNLEGVDLACANLRGADLRYARLRGANLYSGLLQGALLDRADLSSVNLFSAELVEVSMDETRFSKARFGHTAIANVNLARAVGLDQAVHVEPSPIDGSTLRRTAAALSGAGIERQREVFHFLAGAGFDADLLEVVRSWIGRPAEV